MVNMEPDLVATVARFRTPAVRFQSCKGNEYRAAQKPRNSSDWMLMFVEVVAS